MSYRPAEGEQLCIEEKARYVKSVLWGSFIPGQFTITNRRIFFEPDNKSSAPIEILFDDIVDISPKETALNLSGMIKIKVKSGTVHTFSQNITNADRLKLFNRFLYHADARAGGFTAATRSIMDPAVVAAADRLLSDPAGSPLPEGEIGVFDGKPPVAINPKKMLASYYASAAFGEIGYYRFQKLTEPALKHDIEIKWPSRESQNITAAALSENGELFLAAFELVPGSWVTGDLVELKYMKPERFTVGGGPFYNVPRSKYALISADNRFIVLADDTSSGRVSLCRLDNDVKNAASQSNWAQFDTGYVIRGLAWSSNNILAAAGSSGGTNTVKLFINPGPTLNPVLLDTISFPVPKPSLWGVGSRIGLAFFANSDLLVVGNNEGNDGIRLFSISEKRLLCETEKMAEPSAIIKAADQANLIFSASWSKLRVWRVDRTAGGTSIARVAEEALGGDILAMEVDAGTKSLLVAYKEEKGWKDRFHLTRISYEKYLK